MFDYEAFKIFVASGLKKYLGVPIIRADQNQKPPPYDYGTYKATTPMGENKGTYGEYEDGTARKPVKSIWSFSFLSDKETNSFNLANKARTWFDYVGATYLSDNNIIVESVGAVGNRDNILTIEYEYKKGFDVTFLIFDEIEIPETETIEAVEIGDSSIETPPTADELNEKLEKRLSGEVS